MVPNTPPAPTEPPNVVVRISTSTAMAVACRDRSFGGRREVAVLAAARSTQELPKRRSSSSPMSRRAVAALARRRAQQVAPRAGQAARVAARGPARSDGGGGAEAVSGPFKLAKQAAPSLRGRGSQASGSRSDLPARSRRIDRHQHTRDRSAANAPTAADGGGDGGRDFSTLRARQGRALQFAGKRRQDPSRRRARLHRRRRGDSPPTSTGRDVRRGGVAAAGGAVRGARRSATARAASPSRNCARRRGCDRRRFRWAGG